MLKGSVYNLEAEGVVTTFSVAQWVNNSEQQQQQSSSFVAQSSAITFSSVVPFGSHEAICTINETVFILDLQNLSFNWCRSCSQRDWITARNYSRVYAVEKLSPVPYTQICELYELEIIRPLIVNQFQKEQLVSTLNCALRSKYRTDLKIKIGNDGSNVPCHSVIIATLAPALYKLASNEAAEQRVITITSVNEFKAVKLFIDYIYSDFFHAFAFESIETLQNVRKLAEEFELRQLSEDLSKLMLARLYSISLEQAFELEKKISPEMASNADLFQIIKSANLDYRECKYESALELYNRALTVAKQTKTTLKLLGRKCACLTKLGRTEEALKVCEESYKVDKNQGKILYRMGLIQSQKEETKQKALTVLLEAVKVDKSPQYLYEACRVYESLQVKQEDAERILSSNFFSRQFEKLVNQELFSDFVFQYNGKKYFAHSIFFASCSYITSLLEKQSNQGITVNLDLLHFKLTEAAILMMLKWFYTREPFRSNYGKVNDFIAACNLFNLLGSSQAAVKHIEKILSAKLNNRTADRIEEYAERAESLELLTKARQFSSKNNCSKCGALVDQKVVKSDSLTCSEFSYLVSSNLVQLIPAAKGSTGQIDTVVVDATHGFKLSFTMQTESPQIFNERQDTYRLLSSLMPLFFQFNISLFIDEDEDEEPRNIFSNSYDMNTSLVSRDLRMNNNSLSAPITLDKNGGQFHFELKILHTKLYGPVMFITINSGDKMQIINELEVPACNLVMKHNLNSKRIFARITGTQGMLESKLFIKDLKFDALGIEHFEENTSYVNSNIYLICSECKKRFIPSKNDPMGCGYHPGEMKYGEVRHEPIGMSCCNAPDWYANFCAFREHTLK